jgi:hypothetical protein
MTKTEDGSYSVATIVDGFEIRDNAEMPPRVIRSSYPFGTLQPGQSFVISCESKKHEASIRSMAVGRNRKAKDEGKEDHFVVRRLPDNVVTEDGLPRSRKLFPKDLGVWRVS